MKKLKAFDMTTYRAKLSEAMEALADGYEVIVTRRKIPYMRLVRILEEDRAALKKELEKQR